MIIAAASLSDAEAMARIHRAARRTAMPWLPVLHGPQAEHRFFRDLVLPRETVLVARTGGRTVGFVSVDGGWLRHLYVAPEHWGGGAGTRLLDAAKAGRSALQLWVFRGNRRARRFYAERGFRDCEFTDGRRNEEGVPDLRMAWFRSP